jgi:hypothetical protein
MPLYTFVATVECDRCPNEVIDLSADEYDALMSILPECEYAPGRIMLRCTAWPKALHARISR